MTDFVDNFTKLFKSNEKILSKITV